jgi:hypothetical protein
MANDWWAPLVGVAFIVLAIVSIVIGGEPPDPDEGAQKMVEFYTDNKDSIIWGAAIEGLCAGLLIFFGGVFRRELKLAEGEHGTLSLVAFAGTVCIGLGLAIDATINFAIAEAAEDIDPVAVHALGALWANDFMPMAVGLFLFLIAGGLSIVRHGALPKWLGWVMVLFGVLAITPAGFAAFLAAALIVLVISVMLTLRARKGLAGAAPPPAAPTAPAV